MKPANVHVSEMCEVLSVSVTSEGGEAWGIYQKKQQQINQV